MDKHLSDSTNQNTACKHPQGCVSDGSKYMILVRLEKLHQCHGKFQQSSGQQLVIDQ
ncbi:hypothetical protein T06_6839 [Trichinella sp. T6]|nr:hypothetical protein T06_6839 [Trichinella sp. T6]